MKSYKSTPQKTKAQAMVEFAIVLPLLLLLLYGLLEAGRLLFIYSTIVTASRQAVRYGSATGQGVSTTVPRYQDCNGIRAAAQRVDFLNAFDDGQMLQVPTCICKPLSAARDLRSARYALSSSFSKASRSVMNSESTRKVAA